jgi:transposase
VYGLKHQKETYRATVDVPARFRNSKAVGAVFGLTPSKYQSGEISRTGAISKCGDEMMRVMLQRLCRSFALAISMAEKFKGDDDGIVRRHY